MPRHRAWACDVIDRLSEVPSTLRLVELSQRAWSVWAKSDREKDQWLPLVTHQADSAFVAGMVWDDWLPDNVRRLVDHQVGGGEPARALVVFLAAAHDVGKASPAFSMQCPALASRMRDQGLSAPTSLPDRAIARHEIVSQLALEEWLRGRGWSLSPARAFAAVVGSHHGISHPGHKLVSVKNSTALAGAGRWAEVRAELIDAAAELAGVEPHLERWSRQPFSVPIQALLSAVVIVSDWIASDSDLFPYGAPQPDRHASGWERLALPLRWEASEPPTVDSLISDRFGLPGGAAPRPVQRAAVEAALAMPVPGVMVIEAEMGSGKTEAALAAAEVLAHRFGCGGVFVALPTMATSDAMFGRVRRWVESLPSGAAGSERSMFLAHGKAALNRDFQALGVVCPTQVAPDDDALVTVLAHEWLRGRKKGVLASFVIGTIDQVLFGGLKSKHLALRHLALAGKVVIVDEVHAADDFSRAFLESVLHWLGAYSTPVVLLSATLPEAQRRALLDAYTAGRTKTHGDEPPAQPSPVPPGYPSVSWVAGATAEAGVVSPSRTTQQVHIETADDDDASLVRLLQELLRDGGCVGVVRNTVTRAQQTAAVLRQHFGDDVVLLHSRYIATDRAERERALVEMLGPPGPGAHRPDRLVVVGTQVIEQSLDIDLDLLVTDLAPVDLVLQRLGRLHRHRRRVGEGGRPGPLREPRCVLVGVTDWNAAPPKADRGSRAVYGASRLMRAAAVLSPHLATGHLTLPDDIAPLVQAAYAEAVDVPEDWRAALDEADELHRRRVADQRARAGQWSLGSVPNADDGGILAPSLNGWVDLGVGEAETARGAAHVRDAEDTLEVVVVQRTEGRVHLLPWVEHRGDRFLDGFGAPPEGVARAAARCTLRLPVQLSRGAAGDELLKHLEETHFPQWQGSHWLAGQLALVLDQDLRARVPGVDLHYDRDTGLTVARIQEKTR